MKRRLPPSPPLPLPAMPDTFPIAIIGAGASGLMAAISANRTRPRSAVLLEKEARVGRKLLATGNGRCNLINLRPAKGAYHGSGAHVARALLEIWPPAAVLEVFDSLGLTCREEADGRVYPFSGQASSVLDALRLACDRLHVHTETGAAVASIAPEPGIFRLALQDGRKIACRRVIVAGGGMAQAALGADGSALGLLSSLGLAVAEPFPALAPLCLQTDAIRGLKGIRAQGVLSLRAGGKTMAREAGEILFTEYGVSGIAAMQLARRVHLLCLAGEAVQVSIALMDAQVAKREAARRTERMAGEPMARFFTGLLPARLGDCLLRQAGLAKDVPIAPRHAARLSALLHDFAIPVRGVRPFAQAQVTAGGACLCEFDGETLGSYRVPGLYACGEVLDVDGDCGGYNLLWAWVSGLVAGAAAARSLEEA